MLCFLSYPARRRLNTLLKNAIFRRVRKIVKRGYQIPYVCLSVWYDIFVNCNWVVTRWQQYSTHLHTNNTQNETKEAIRRTTQQLDECGPCPVLASYTLEFALQPRKKHGKTSVRVEHGKTSVRVEHGKTSVRVEHGKTSVSVEHGKTSVRVVKPQSGQSTEKPQSGQSTDKPQSGQSTEKPQLGQSTVKPQSGYVNNSDTTAGIFMKISI